MDSAEMVAVVAHKRHSTAHLFTMNETTILQRIRLALGRVPGLRLFRQNVGALKDEHGRIVRFGLHPGSADLIGWRSVEITPDMVGRRVAVFTSIEVKTPTGRLRPDQANWQAQVEEAGGIAIIARSESDALAGLQDS
jgi:hypothetical protein